MKKNEEDNRKSVMNYNKKIHGRVFWPFNFNSTLNMFSNLK